MLFVGGGRHIGPSMQSDLFWCVLSRHHLDSHHQQDSFTLGRQVSELAALVAEWSAVVEAPNPIL